MNLCVYDSEERDRGVSVGVIPTMLFETLQVVGVYDFKFLVYISSVYCESIK